MIYIYPRHVQHARQIYGLQTKFQHIENPDHLDEAVPGRDIFVHVLPLCQPMFSVKELRLVEQLVRKARERGLLIVVIDMTAIKRTSVIRKPEEL